MLSLSVPDKTASLGPDVVVTEPQVTADAEDADDESSVELDEPEEQEEPELVYGKEKAWAELYMGAEGGHLPPTLLRQLTHFRRKQDKGFIDVWWLYDDGGEWAESAARHILG